MSNQKTIEQRLEWIEVKVEDIEGLTEALDFDPEASDIKTVVAEIIKRVRG